MRVLCLIDSQPMGKDRWLFNNLPENEVAVDFICTKVKDRFAKWGKLLAYYPAFLFSGFKAIQATRKKRYDVIIAWEGKNGFPLAMVRRSFTQNRVPFVVLSFSVRGLLGYFPGVQQYGARGIDYMTVPTHFEQDYYSALLSYPREKILFCPLGSYDLFANLPKCTEQDFIFTGGRSGRDYRTFFAAVSGTEIPSVVNARPFNLRGLAIPKNVKINDILPTVEYRDLHRQARFVVVPLLNLKAAAGLTAILYAMAAGKAAVVSDVPGVRDYVRDGETGLIVPPDDIDGLRKAIEALWQNPHEAERMGKNARKVYRENFTFELFAGRTYRILQKIIREF